MMPLSDKASRIKDLVCDHLACVRETIEAFERSLRAYFGDHDLSLAEEDALAVHRLEGHADDVRRAVERTLIEGALLPRSRHDLLRIVEQVDRLANAAEAIVDRLLIERPAVPADVEPMVLRLAEASVGVFDDVHQALCAVLDKQWERAAECTSRIEKGRSHVRQLDDEAMRQAFDRAAPLAERLHTARFLRDMEMISQRAGRLSDLLNAAVAARDL